jgi:hypothetical protein
MTKGQATRQWHRADAVISRLQWKVRSDILTDADKARLKSAIGSRARAADQLEAEKEREARLLR